jgi:hypothetical protein
VVDIRGVQSHLITELVEPTEQAIDAPLWGERSCLQDPEAGTIHSFSLSIFFCINLFITLDSMMQKKSIGVEHHYMDVWLPLHDDDEATVEKLVNNSIKCYA